MSSQLAAAMRGPVERFRFVYCSGMGAESVQDRKLWAFNDARKLKVGFQDAFEYALVAEETSRVWPKRG